jgi:hypothetical protein
MSSASFGSQLGRTSSYSGDNGNCVTVAMGDDSVRVGDSKHPETAPLGFTPNEWVAFVLGVKNGEFDPPAEWVAAFRASRDNQPA